MSGRFNKKVAIVTGGSSGIGAAIVERLAAERASVVSARRNSPPAGDAVVFHRTDVSSLSSVEAMVTTTLDRFDRLDVLVNNVGVGALAEAPGLYLDVWHLYRRGLDYGGLREVDPKLIGGVQLDDAAVETQGDITEDCLDHSLLPGEGPGGNSQVRLRPDGDRRHRPLSLEVISNAQRARPLGEAARVSFQAAQAVVDAVAEARAQA